MFGVEDVDESRLVWLLEREKSSRRLDAQELRYLAALDADGYCDREYGMATGAWLAARAGLPAMLTFGQTRYRAPAEVSLVLLTAVAADFLWSGRHTATGLQERFARGAATCLWITFGERPRDSDGGRKPPPARVPKGEVGDHVTCTLDAGLTSGL